MGVVTAVFAHEAFAAGPGFDQGAVGGEVLVVGPAFLAGKVIDFGEEQPGHAGVEPAVVILGEGAVVEAAFGQLAVEKPQPEQIVADLLAQEALAAHGVKGGEPAGLEQLLGRDARPAQLGVELVKEGRELLEDVVQAGLERAQADAPPARRR